MSSNLFFTFFSIPDEEKPAGARRPQAVARDGPRRAVAARNARARRAAGVIKMFSNRPTVKHVNNTYTL